MTDDLPPGWAIATLESVTDPERPICYGILMPKDHEPDGVPYVRVKDFPLGKIDVPSLRRTSPSIASRYARSSLAEGDVLISIRGTYGRSALVPRELRGGNVTQDSARLAPNEAVGSRFLLYYLRSPGVQQSLREVARGVAVKGVNIRDLKALPILVPPRAEQDRIVDAIEEQLSRLDHAVRSVVKVRSGVATLRSAIMAAAYSGRLAPQNPDDEPAKLLIERCEEVRRTLLGRSYRPATQAAVGHLYPIPDGWCWTSLDAITAISGGVTKDAKRQSDPTFVEVPYLRVANVQRGYLDLDQVTTIRVPPEKLTALRLQPGDVLFNEGGDRDKLGRGWVWEGRIQNCIHQNHVFRARPLDQGIQSKFLSWHGNFFGRWWFEAHGKQTTNLASINMTTLRSLPVPLPPAEEQARIVAEVERQFSILDALERTAGTAIPRAASLRGSLLAAAFRGDLVRQDLNDEPATALLASIELSRSIAPSRRRRQGA